MATTNFNNVNASNVFSVDMESLSMDEIRDDLMEFFRDKGYDHLRKNDPYTQVNDGAESIASLEMEKFFQVKTSAGWIGVWGEIAIEVYLRPGYYQGANLDWVLQYRVNVDIEDHYVDELPKVEWIIDEVKAQMWEEEFTEKHAKVIAERMQKWFTAKAKTLINKTEKLMGKVSTPLRAIGTASNGETFYEIL